MNRYLSPWFKVLPTSLMLLAVAVNAADDLATTKKAAEEGDAAAQFRLGHMYVNSDVDKTFHW